MNFGKSVSSFPKMKLSFEIDFSFVLTDFALFKIFIFLALLQNKCSRMFVCFILHIEKQNVNSFFEKMFGKKHEHFLFLEREEK